MNGVLIIIAALIMRTYPSNEDVQGGTYYYYPGRWIQFQDGTYLHNFHSQGSIPCQAAYHGVTGKYIHNISFTSYRVRTHLYTWLESSNVDKVSCWRTKVPGIDGNRTRNPLIQSQGFTPIYHGTSTYLDTYLQPTKVLKYPDGAHMRKKVGRF